MTWPKARIWHSRVTTLAQTTQQDLSIQPKSGNVHLDDSDRERVQRTGNVVMVNCLTGHQGFSTISAGTN